MLSSKYTTIDLLLTVNSTMGRISEAEPVEVMKDRFLMVKKLGGGAFGQVYLIRRKENKEMMAAKHQRMLTEEARRYVRREVEILDLLDSDNPDIVSLVDYYESPAESVILTEYLVGGELFERISSRNYDLTEQKCQGFMRQVST